MLLSQVLDNYLDKYPIYKSINFSIDSKSTPEKLPPLFVITQHIIDTFISNGSKRIAIVLPDNECNILPLIIAKYFSNVQHQEDYAGNVLEEIEIGQHLRLGKAVVEFGGIIADEKEKRAIGIKRDGKYIRFITGKKNKMTRYCPINGVHHLFEKTDAALSSDKVWIDAQEEAEKKLKSANSIIAALKVKRTVLRKTIALLSPKNDFRDIAASIRINGLDFEEVLSFGEIDLDSDSNFRLYNKGRLDCLPSIAITSKIEEIYYLLKDKSIKEKIFAIFSTIDKFDEIINNPDTFKRILKHNIPFVTFVPESGFESCTLLTDFGFDIWHWKPSTMKSEALLVAERECFGQQSKCLFSKFNQKINRAALSEFSIEKSNDLSLRKLIRLISVLSQQAYHLDDILHQFVRLVWSFQNKLTWLICPIRDRVRTELEEEFLKILQLWEGQKKYYTGQAIEKTVEEILSCFLRFMENEKPSKALKLEKFLSRVSDKRKSIVVLVPNKYRFFSETVAFIKSIQVDCQVQLKTLSDFYSQQNKKFASVDYLVVSWFDKDEYINIKQTYCYENLTLVLYDYENKWRERYVKRVDECLPHETIKKIADTIGLDQADIDDKPLDRVFSTDSEEFKDISDYNISNAIIRSTFGDAGITQDSADAVECIPIILSDDKIAYFYPSHDVFDVTALSRGDADRPFKKEALKLRKGDRILIRQSDKDIIREKADSLMVQAGEYDLRERTETWSALLKAYARGKSIMDVCRSLNEAGGECTVQQVRYWLYGETIIPRSKDILIAIGIVASSIDRLKKLCDRYLGLIDSIYDAGRIIQGYHQKAGRWLSGELKNRAQEIKKIANNGYSCGELIGIGEIQIYTVEDVLDKEIIASKKINRIEDLF